MPDACSEEDRLRQVYYQARREATSACKALSALSFGPEFMAALDKANADQRAADAAWLAYQEHCSEHGCGKKFYGQRW